MFIVLGDFRVEFILKSGAAVRPVFLAAPDLEGEGMTAVAEVCSVGSEIGIFMFFVYAFYI